MYYLFSSEEFILSLRFFFFKKTHTHWVIILWFSSVTLLISSMGVFCSLLGHFNFCFCHYLLIALSIIKVNKNLLNVLSCCVSLSRSCSCKIASVSWKTFRSVNSAFKIFTSRLHKCNKHYLKYIKREILTQFHFQIMMTPSHWTLNLHYSIKSISYAVVFKC